MGYPYLTLFLLPFLILQVSGHGMIAKPASRASLWRYEEFSEFNPPYYRNDRELHCGGFIEQHWNNNGSCGPCGDAWQLPVPRAFENTGEFGRGILVANYTSGEDISVEIYIEAAHSGYFEFRVCSLTRPEEVETESCFGEPLHILESNDTRFPFGWDSGTVLLTVRLPQDLICERCVFQWEYVTGNVWDECEDGSEGLGCGPQETFRNCADISIL